MPKCLHVLSIVTCPDCNEISRDKDSKFAHFGHDFAKIISYVGKMIPNKIPHGNGGDHADNENT